MAVTRSTAANRPRAGRAHHGWRTTELLGTLAAALIVAFGLHLVHQAKSADLAEIDHGLASKQLLNLNGLAAREDLLPALSSIADQHAREEAARQVYYISGGLGNVGALARIHGLFTSEQFRQLKPLFVVRRPAQFQSAFYRWSVLFFAAFLAVHLFWSLRGFRGDQFLLPAVMLLTGAGLILMIALRDPVRDNLLFVDFAQGAVGGCLLLAALSALDYRRLLGKLTFVPLLASFALSAALILFGHGPGSSDAKVNLLGFQPVEIIRLLLVLFLAGYFATRWDVLRHARETRPRLAALTSRLDIPPVEFTLPALVCAALSVVFFFLQRDMGPALVFACLFLVLYGMARGSALVPVAGLALVVMGFVVGYFIGIPHTVNERVSMWLSPWDNRIHGGDQLAHSLWAYATGGATGMGTGRGDPQLVPAGHTDLILSALGEEWGFAGVAAVFALYGLIVWRALRAALRAATDYEFFLAAGLAAATTLQLLLIAGGSLGVVPLSGVVTPFLSYGRTAMLANFAVVGMLEAISHRGRQEDGPTPFRRATIAVGAIFAVAGAVVLAKAGYVQVARSAVVMGEGTLVLQADGARRYQYNPRFQEVMREIPMGAIYDRNGLPLATSNWDELARRRADYQALGIDINRNKGLTASVPIEGLSLVERDEKTGEVHPARKRSELEGFFVPFAVAMILAMIVMVGSAPMLQNVTQDKTQRIVETLLGAATPFELMTGKVLGSVGVSVTSSVLYVLAGTVAVNALGVAGLLPLTIIPWFYVYLLADVVMLCAFAAALGACCSTPQDAQNLAIVLLMPCLIPMFMLVTVLRQPNGTLATVMSLVPPFTPILMLLRQAMPGGVPAWQPWVGLLGVLLFVAATVWAASRIFRVAILMQGKPPRLAEMVRWAMKG